MINKYPEVPVDQLRKYCDPDSLTFNNTDELVPLEGTVGQDKGVSAIKFGLGIKTRGFNIYVSGPTGTGKESTVAVFVSEQAQNEKIPNDLCYVHNFKEADQPRAITLSSGIGNQFVKDMDELIEATKRDIPRAFEDENYEKKRNDVVNEMQQEKSKLFTELQTEAQGLGLAIEMTNAGIVTVPMQHGKPVSREDFEKLPASEQEYIEKGSEQLQAIIQLNLAKARKIEKAASEKIQQLDRDVALFAVGHKLDDLRSEYRDHPDILEYLEQVQDDMMEHLEDFKERERPKIAIPGLEDLQVAPTFDRYKVNLLVSNQNQKGAPVVIENNPSYYNIIGRVDFKARMGALTTDFSMIKAGALHKANGGYLIMQAMDVLVNPMAWDALKRAIRQSEVRIENIAEHYGLIPTSTLKPEPIPLDVKVILIGNPMIFHMLYAYDEDFQKLFKVKADFDVEMTRNDDHVEKYAQFIAGQVKENHLKPFDRTGVAKIVEYGSRLIEDKDKLSTKFLEIVDIVSESSYWSYRNGNTYVMADDVQKAIDEKKFRSDLSEQKIQELMDQDIIMIDTVGETVGQVNGLSVYSIGNYTFGRPSRITARTYIGKSGVMNIERETKMSGPIHDKGVLILSGYLNGKYAVNNPLPLGASLTFEQLYEGVEGDSASSTELYALLSSLADLPVSQEIAVTGSVNQMGEIQPIGGVTWKIEGFFEVCKSKGLTGNQGVIIPLQNVRHLMLNDEIVEAVKDGRFHIWPISKIDEGIEILTGAPAGEKDEHGVYPEGTVHGRVCQKLNAFVNILKEFGAPESEKKDIANESRRIAAQKYSGYRLRRQGRRIR